MAITQFTATPSTRRPLRRSSSALDVLPVVALSESSEIQQQGFLAEENNKEWKRSTSSCVEGTSFIR